MIKLAWEEQPVGKRPLGPWRDNTRRNQQILCIGKWESAHPGL